MDGKVTQEILTLIISIIFWIILFFLVRRMINKSFESQKRLQPKTADFDKKLYDELQRIYHLQEKQKIIELNSDKFVNLVTDGKLLLSSLKVGDTTILTVEYKRKMKFTGFLLVMLGLLFCYVGVLVPILIVQSTKKNAFKEIDKIFEISKGL